MSGDWVYRVTVPADKTDAFIKAMVSLDLLGESSLEVLEEGGRPVSAPYELRVAVISGPAPEGYTRVPNGEKIAEFVGPLAGEYPALSLVACALNANWEAKKGNRSERGYQYYVHPTGEPKAA